jgi:EAL domain-containing protein (putative c-di-GMP-specific phosphodiesterase class I)
MPAPSVNSAPNGTTAAAGEARSPLAFIIDEEASIRQFVSLILQGGGVDTIEFVDGPSFRDTQITRAPDLVFLNVNLEAQDAVQSIETLSRSDFAGAVQLISNRGSAVLDTVKQAGELMKIRMLPVLKKPFETSAIQKTMSELKLGHGPASSGVRVELAEALKNNWVEFWYQPKIDLRRKQLAGAEAFVRVCHPKYGILTPKNFMPDADEASVLTLAERALVSALQSGLNLSRFGVELRIAINVPVKCLIKLPVGKIVREHRPAVDAWPGLMIDVTEEQILSEITLANELSRTFAEHNVRLAIDDFGKGCATLMKLKELPFAEMKLDRSFVVGCGTDKVHAPICKTVINLAHSFGALAVGIGLEKASDTMALISMGCDLGQGFLFGQPMPEERFIALLKQRVTVRPAAMAAAAPAKAALQTA